ncbi:S8 family serine peptidase [Nocardioides sp.]|uniref:S8 family serine peptidase n=1 Tax=Nocardioides sp. TaxID=35761 RepID=UPI0027328D8A|nr:S8 family serine peptidase [Nocardioides sp.]MDP3892511.1 S8 family serine peptidase [Nocardioides sp.]
MRTFTLSALATATAVALATGYPAATAAPGHDTGATSSGAYIVVLKDTAPAAAVAGEHGRAHGADVGHVYRNAMRGYSARMSATAAAKVAADPRVDWIQRDGVVQTTAQELPTGINRANGNESSTKAGDGSGTVDVDVAVIDTGIDLDHPDLNVHTAGAKNCSSGRSADDGNGHGTHVAGTVGAIDNTTGVVGMAPGARLWPVRVLNNRGSGSWSDVICGIDYVAANADKIEVANMSLGGAGTDLGNCGNGQDAMHAAICNAVAQGVTFVVAAGNDAQDAAGFTPAAYDEVITVSALADFNGLPVGGAAPTCRADVDDTFANFSNYGADVDLIAPGVCINSTWKGGGYNTISGTSMAAPHVAGAAALYLSTRPGATPAQVRSALQSAGSTDWNNSDDPDGIKERLLDASAF